MAGVTEAIERALSQHAGLFVAALEDSADESVVLSGFVTTEGEREEALRIAAELAGDRRLVDDITVTDAPPEEVTAIAGTAGGDDFLGDVVPGEGADESLEAGDFTNVDSLASPQQAEGATSSLDEDPGADGDLVYVPPTDPVATNEAVIGGFQFSSMDELTSSAPPTARLATRQSATPSSASCSRTPQRPRS